MLVFEDGDPQTSSTVVARDTLDQALIAKLVITDRDNVCESNGHQCAILNDR